MLIIAFACYYIFNYSGNALPLILYCFAPIINRGIMTTEYGTNPFQSERAIGISSKARDDEMSCATSILVRHKSVDGKKEFVI